MKYDPVNVLIGSRLKELRLARKYSLEYVAEKIGKSDTNIFFYENGRHTMSIPVLKKLCDLYGVDMLKFLDEIMDQL